MKPVRTFNECEHCGVLLPQGNPEEAYENARVDLAEHSVMLLPVNRVKELMAQGKGETHAVGISGYYCCPNCLLAHLQDLLGAPSPSPIVGRKRSRSRR